MRSKYAHIFILFLVSHSLVAQLGLNEKDIILKQGNYFKREILDSSVVLYYKSSIKNDFGKMNSEMISYHMDKNSNICFQVIYATSKSAINRYISLLNNFGIKESDYKWVDYKNRSAYVLKYDENFVGIEHFYINQDEKNIPDTNQNFLEKKVQKCAIENQKISEENKLLQLEKLQLINTRDSLTSLCSQVADNLEKSLQALKEKDKKIERLQKALTRKDSITVEYINKLKIQKN